MLHKLSVRHTPRSHAMTYDSHAITYDSHAMIHHSHDGGWVWGLCVCVGGGGGGDILYDHALLSNDDEILETCNLQEDISDGVDCVVLIVLCRLCCAEHY